MIIIIERAASRRPPILDLDPNLAHEARKLFISHENHCPRGIQGKGRRGEEIKSRSRSSIDYHGETSDAGRPDDNVVIN